MAKWVVLVNPTCHCFRYFIFCPNGTFYHSYYVYLLVQTEDHDIINLQYRQRKTETSSPN